jgi:hypothetical protein
MPITLLDGILVGFTLVSAMLAMVRGFSREILSIASWVLAAIAAYFLYPVVLPFVTPYIDNAMLALAVAAAAVFFVALIIVTVITMKIADFIVDSRIGALDRTLGFLYGAVRGVLDRRSEVAAAARSSRRMAAGTAAGGPGEVDFQSHIARKRRSGRRRNKQLTA